VTRENISGSLFVSQPGLAFCQGGWVDLRALEMSEEFQTNKPRHGELHTSASAPISRGEAGQPANPGEKVANAATVEERLAYSIKDCAAALGISRSKIYTIIAENGIRAQKIGSRTIITTAELKRFLSSLPRAHK
jgi:excisionase family DNA binding protein